MKNCPKCTAKKAAAKAMAPAKPLVETIAKTVAYQKDNIVSREIIRQRNGTVTVFAFDEGQGLSEHAAPFDALSRCWRVPSRSGSTANRSGSRPADDRHARGPSPRPDGAYPVQDDADHDPVIITTRR